MLVNDTDFQENIFVSLGTKLKATYSILPFFSLEG